MRAQAVPELALMSTGAGGAAQLVAEALRAGEGAVRPDLLQALRGAAAAVLPMDAVQESAQPPEPTSEAAQHTVVRANGAKLLPVRRAREAPMSESRKCNEFISARDVLF